MSRSSSVRPPGRRRGHNYGRPSWWTLAGVAPPETGRAGRTEELRDMVHSFQDQKTGPFG
ncbi:hypothetical protein [Jiangella alkaliphila]|uniref:Uncharacterized protein n=1 Tax=Jiangella alkaliphila TaxID=419479 RepID=A0A1H2M8K8_9ACTN|nr:hypothetical protein [Jiangella alkaliphila]SDU89509.1 hypothetical protein SAMN04488563_7204 [Jiangella alkaliphila]